MSQNTETVPFRNKLKVSISNFLQKYRTVLLAVFGGAILIVVAFAVWTQMDAGSKNAFAAKIEKSQLDYNSWLAESDEAKKTALSVTLEAELADIQKNAPTGYGLSKAWFLQGSYWASLKKWSDAAKAFHMVYDKDKSGYLAPIALVNAAVSQEEAGDLAAALGVYEEFVKVFAADALLAPQVFFSQGRILESQGKTAEAVTAYQQLLAKFPESSWTKLGRDRILLLSQE